MIKLIQNLIFIISTVIALIIFMIRLGRDAIFNLIKFNFRRNIGKMSVHEVILDIIVKTVDFAELLVMLAYIYICIKYKEKFVIPYLMKNGANTSVEANFIVTFLTILSIVSLVCMFAILYDTKKRLDDSFYNLNIYSRKHNGKWQKFCCILSMVINILFFISFLFMLEQTIEKKISINVNGGIISLQSELLLENYINILVYSVMIMFYLWSISMLLSALHIISDLEKDIIFTLKLEKEIIICKFYIEYKNFYLVYDQYNNKERFIAKGEIKEIKKTHSDNKKITRVKFKKLKVYLMSILNKLKNKITSNSVGYIAIFVIGFVIGNLDRIIVFCVNLFN